MYENNKENILLPSKKSILFFIVLLLLVYSVIVSIANYQDIISEIKNIHLISLLFVLFATLGNYFLRTVKWRIGTRRISTIPLKRDVLLYISGFIFSITPSKIGEIARAWMLKSEDPNVKLTDGISLSIIDRLSDLIALSLLTCLVVLFQVNRELFQISFVFFILIIIVTVLIFHPKFIDLMVKLSSKISNKIAKFLSDINEALLTYGRFLFSISIFLSVISWCLEGIGLYLISRSLGINVTVQTAILIFSLGTLIGALSFLPGGLGGAEFSMLALFLNLTKSSKSAAIGAVVVIRIATLWFGLLLGCISYALWFITKPK